ncbi:hypothetical protein BU23DRAFT_662859 [Bimuria novae-zelandiae CBS 107.79]|uniref:Uncharacterized protein n=1 Tax=Bimuria novae-zelandiae CBS 107.79 TaxID=1447943 RepID=A0A6A5VI18_9PLEO|nr:hypothetical protein BU23DRAFT_662859 [Bimuria novae-zelandiae CBS 107.79]
MISWDAIRDLSDRDFDFPFSEFSDDHRRLRAVTKVYFVWAGHAKLDEVDPSNASTFYEEVTSAWTILQQANAKWTPQCGHEELGVCALQPVNPPMLGAATPRTAFSIHDQSRSLSFINNGSNVSYNARTDRIEAFIQTLPTPTFHGGSSVASRASEHRTRKRKTAEDVEAERKRFKKWAEMRDEYTKLTSQHAQLNYYKEKLNKYQRRIEDKMSAQFTAGELLRFQAMESMDDL